MLPSWVTGKEYRIQNYYPTKGTLAEQDTGKAVTCDLDSATPFRETCQATEPDLVGDVIVQRPVVHHECDFLSVAVRVRHLAGDLLVQEVRLQDERAETGAWDSAPH